MNLSNAKDYLPFVQAAAEGKVIQFRNSNGKWIDLLGYERPDFSAPPDHYRIKPTPNLRPWKPEEVPVGALLRRFYDPNNIVVILGNTMEKLILSDKSPNCSYYIKDVATYHGGHNGDRMEHSLDHGKTWLPCGIME